MKWYLHKHYFQHLEDVKIKRGEAMELYYPWVIQLANTFARDNVAIGALNLQDLVQAGYVGLIEAFNLVDHSKSQGEKWSYIKKRIKFSIRREIDNHGAFIKVPRRQLEEHRKNLTNTDKILVNSFPKFFDTLRQVAWSEDTGSWENHQLSLLIDDYLYENIKNIDHIEILKARFGIDRDKPMSIKGLATKYRKSEIGIKKIQSRMIENLKQNEKFKIIIENFYEN